MTGQADEAALPPPPRGSPADRFWRVVYRVGFPLACRWWGLWQPSHRGALVAVHVGPALLLLRASYRSEWNFPGGGLLPGETPEVAARRELAEETGIIADTLHPAGIARGLWDGRRDTVHFFELRLDRLPPLRLDGREIIGARLVPPEVWQSLPLTGPVAAYVAGGLAPD